MAAQIACQQQDNALSDNKSPLLLSVFCAKKNKPRRLVNSYNLSLEIKK